MPNRLEETESQTPANTTLPSLILRTAPNWTALFFFAALASLHWYIAVPAFYHHRREGLFSLAFAVIFSVVSFVCWLVASELSIEPSTKRIRLRSGYGRLSVERFISFRDVHGVRVTHSSSRSALACRVEVLCDNEDLECPPTMHPNQQALCMAMMMKVRLIKVYPTGAEAERCNA